MFYRAEMMDATELPELLFGCVLGLVGLLILYLVIRLAVRHAIQDADRRSTGR